MNYHVKVTTILVPVILSLFIFIQLNKIPQSMLPENTNPVLNLDDDVSFANPQKHESTAKLNEVSFALAKHLIATRVKGQNFVFSPISIQAALGMVAEGSSGPTRQQVLRYLKSDNSTEHLGSLVKQLFASTPQLGGPQIAFSSGVWVDKSFSLKESFKNVVEEAYGAVVRNLDFNKLDEAIREINAWANEKTNGLIKEIIPFHRNSPRIVLGNAMYFKGDWAQKFDASYTREHPFFLSNGTAVQVPFMTSYAKQYVSSFDGFKVLRLPYKHGQDKRRFSMYLYLPDSKDGLPALIEKICSESGFLEKHLPHGLVEVGSFRIPKFKLDYSFEASEVLQEQGLVLPFLGGLTEMLDQVKDLVVRHVFHKAFIEVNEEGTEAAAVAMFVADILLFPEHDFVADHPFLFVIREDVSKAVSFIGQVTNPLAG